MGIRNRHRYDRMGTGTMNAFTKDEAGSMPAPLDLHRKWRDELIYQLRLKDVSGNEIGNILCEVEEHIADTRETPEEAFGPAREYAAVRLAAFRDPNHNDFDTSRMLIAGLAFMGMLLYVSGAMSIGQQVNVLGMPPWIPLLAGATILGIGVFSLPVDLVRHPVTNESFLGEHKSFRGTLIAILVVVGLGFYALGRVLA